MFFGVRDYFFERLPENLDFSGRYQMNVIGGNFISGDLLLSSIVVLRIGVVPIRRILLKGEGV